MSSDEWWDKSDDMCYRYKVSLSEEKLYRQETQPTENIIYERNADFRRQEQRKLSFGRYVGTIPDVVLNKWRREHPELTCGDKDIQSRKLLQLMKAHPEVLVVDKSKV